MSKSSNTTPACFEVSWEIANPVGGIHTVIASKAEQMRKLYGDRYFAIGPWLNWIPREHAAFQESAWEDAQLDPSVMQALAKSGVPCRTGRWKVPGNPNGILIDFQGLWSRKDQILAEYWERYGLDSYGAGHDYAEPVLFGIAAAMVVEALYKNWLAAEKRPAILQAHEWLAGSALLRVKHACPEIATVFTTHATALGRSLASRGQIIEEVLGDERARELARECGVTAKHSMEVVTARAADCFTTVSEITGVECERLLGVKPGQIVPNALQDNYPPSELRTPKSRERAREILFKLATEATGVDYAKEPPLVVVTSGRYEFKNKGLDLLTEALGRVQSALGSAPMPKILAFYLVPAGSKSERPANDRENRRVSHALECPDSDPLLGAFDRANLRNAPGSAAHVFFVPKFLDGTDKRVPHPYFDLLPAADLSIFPSWYEPWGYTPMESIALGIPTVTSDLTGFSDWAPAQKSEAVTRLKRLHQKHEDAVTELADHLLAAVRKGPSALRKLESAALRLAKQGQWTEQVSAYLSAYQIAAETVAKKLAPKDPKTIIDSAYFSMEFALTAQLRIYSGGLGVLAGDFVKAAGDLGHKVYGLGLAYRGGYFTQRISPELRQEALPAEHESFYQPGNEDSLTPIVDSKGERIVFGVPLPNGEQIMSQAWRLDYGSAALLLLDTDLDANRRELRALGRRLYTADRRERWLQEYFLGVGGVKLLELMGVHPRWYHMNEGHTAALAFERAHSLIRDRHLTFGEALDEIRETTVFTTHTPVPAGHEEFSRDLCGPEVALSAERLRVSSETLFDLGKSQRHGSHSFSLTALALSTCQRVNGVSRRHREAAHRSFDPRMMEHRDLFYVTNGVHPQTWVSPEWKDCFDRKLGKDWPTTLDAPKRSSPVLELDDKTIWDTHHKARASLVKRIEEKLRNPELLASRVPALKKVQATLKTDPMIAVFARRFTGYKRPGLLFSDPERLSRLFQKYPRTLFLFAGKAHPADWEGQDIIQRVLNWESAPEMAGHLMYLENYDMAEAQLLVSGSDVWVNYPQQPLEASGTSGMKAAMNGVLNLSVDDGWVPEADHGEVPWKIGVGSECFGRATMDWMHAQELYALLESEVLPEYWNRDKSGLPAAWIARMKHAMAGSLPYFSAQRMVREYGDKMGWKKRD